MGSSYLWVKAFHIVFVASWFAGLFYLPRIFVNLAMVAPDSHAERERLLLMARKLYRFANILMVVALVLGFVLWLGYAGWIRRRLRPASLVRILRFLCLQGQNVHVFSKILLRPLSQTRTLLRGNP